MCNYSTSDIIVIQYKKQAMLFVITSCTSPVIVVNERLSDQRLSSLAIGCIRVKIEYVTVAAMTGTTDCALSLSQVTANHSKIGHPKIKFTGAQSSNELQRLDYSTGYQDSSPSNGWSVICPIGIVSYLTFVASIADKIGHKYDCLKIMKTSNKHVT